LIVCTTRTRLPMVRFVFCGGDDGADPAPLPVSTAERLPPPALKVTLELDVVVAVGEKRTVTVCIVPVPASVKGLPDTTLNGAATDTAPESAPPPVFVRVKVRSADAPRLTVPKLTVPVGLTAKSDRATALAILEHAL